MQDGRTGYRFSAIGTYQELLAALPRANDGGGGQEDLTALPRRRGFKGGHFGGGQGI
jgi:hypothetical protein